jgi:transcriptional regulator with XRE-family HTH domain
MLEQPAFGQRLKALRLGRGLTQSELAGEGLSTGYLSRLESGLRPPTSRVVEHLAHRLDVAVSAFDVVDERPSLAQVLATVISSGTVEGVAQVLRDALNSERELAEPLRWQVLWLLAQTQCTQGRHDAEVVVLRDLVELSDRMRVTEFRVRSRTRLSTALRTLGEISAAAEVGQEAHELASGLSVADQVGALQTLISVETEAGRVAEARLHVDQLCALAESAGGVVLAEACWTAATVHLRQGDQDGSRTLIERALGLLDSHEDLTLWMRLRLAAASLYLQLTPAVVDRARAMLDEAAPVLRLIGSEAQVQQLTALRAHLAFEEGSFASARTLCAQLQSETLRLSFRDELRLRMLRSQLMILDGQVEAGARALDELARQARDSQNVELAAEIWRRLAVMLTTRYNGSAASSQQSGEAPSDLTAVRAEPAGA